MQRFGTPGFMRLLTPTPLGGLLVRGDVLKIDRMFVSLGAMPHVLIQETEEKGKDLLRLMQAAFLVNKYGWPPNTPATAEISSSPRPGTDTGQVFNSLSMTNVGGEHPIHIKGADPGSEMTAFFIGVPAGSGMHNPGPCTTLFAEGQFFQNRQPISIVDVAYLLVTPHDAIMPWNHPPVPVPARDFVTPAFDEWSEKYKKSMWRSAHEYCMNRVC